MLPPNFNPNSSFKNVVRAFLDPTENAALSKYRLQLRMVFDLMAEDEKNYHQDYLKKLVDLDNSLSIDLLNPDPKGLVAVLNCADFEFRTKVRNYLLFPNVQASNKEIGLSYLSAALAGDEEARADYESSRFIIDGMLPDWVKDEWEKETKASWRTLRGDSFEFKSFCKKNGLALACAEVPVLELKPLSLALETSDARLGLSIYSAGRLFLEVIDKLNNRPFPDKKNIIAEELEGALQNNFINFLDGSIAGEFYRRSAKTELNQIFTAILINDALTLRGIEISDHRKVDLWRSWFHNPWSIASHKLFIEGPKIRSILRDKGVTPDKLDQEIEKLVFNKHEYREFFKQLNSQPAKKTHTFEIPPHPIELTEETLDSSSSKISVKDKLTVALECHLGHYAELESDVRKLFKLLGNSENKLKIVLEDIANKMSPKDIIEKLRVHTDSHLIANATNLKTESPIPLPQQQQIETHPEAPRTERPKLILSKEVQTALKDPHLNTLVSQTLERLVDRPQSLERRRIWACDDIWEVKLVGQAIRIYYFYPGNKTLAVLKIGDKKDQNKDVPKLNNIKKSILHSIKEQS